MAETLPDDAHWMRLALEQAALAAQAGEVPVGAVVALNGEVIATAHNSPRTLNDPSAHAEMLAIRAAAEILGSERLVDCDLHVTLEPCAMCAAAISFARIRRLYFAAGDEKMGAVEHGPRFYSQPTCHHAPDVYSGLGEDRAKELLKDFFKSRRS